jgi:hypothetical protein
LRRYDIYWEYSPVSMTEEEEVRRIGIWIFFLETRREANGDFLIDL